MRPVSEKFLNSLRGSHGATAEAYVVSAGQTGVIPTGTQIVIIDGDIQLDANASIRSTLDMTTDGTGMFGNNATDLLTPYGNEIFIRVGLVFGGGAVEWVPLGYFRIQDAKQDNAPNGPIQVGAQDRMAGVIDYRLPAPVQFQSTETYGDVVSALVQDVYPWATIQWDDLTYTDFLGRSLVAEEDRFAFLNELVTGLGKIWYWDHRGILVIRNVPAEDDPVWDVDAGSNGVLISMSRELSRDGVYNAVVVTGEALDDVDPVRAIAVNDNPLSPTYWDGAFGKVTTFYNSSFITTVDQAQSAADALLTKKLGLPYNVDFQSIRNPALEPYDAVVVNLAGKSAKPAIKLVEDSFNRTAVDGWGTADSGQTWSNTLSSTFWDVSAGVATITDLFSTAAPTGFINGVFEKDVEGYFTVSVPNVATGSALVFGAATRYTPGTNSYHMRIEFRTDGKVACKFSKFIGSVLTEIAANNPIPGLTYTTGQVWKVRFRNVGTKLKMRVWVDGQAEPSTWHLEATDSDLKEGSVGIWAWKLTGNTNVGVLGSFYDYSASTYPGPPVGSEIHVIDKLTIPLTNDAPMTATTREQTLIVIGEA